MQEEFVVILNYEDVLNVSKMYDDILHIYGKINNNKKPNVSFMKTFNKILSKCKEQGWHERIEHNSYGEE